MTKNILFFFLFFMTAPSSTDTQKVSDLKTTINKYRYNRNLRTIVLVVLLLIVLAMLLFRGKMKWLLLVLLVVIVWALWLHIADYDLDLWTLIKTGSVTESRVETKKWVKIIGSECLTNNLNCSNFASQGDAQEKYNFCADKIAADNVWQTSDSVRRLDVFGLDGDKDGVVCEALPKNEAPAVAE